MNKLAPIGLAAALAASAGIFAPAQAETPPNMLVIAMNIEDIITLDPAEAFELTTGEINSNTYDRLVQFEPEDLQTLAGGVAESWEFSEDGKTITFTIRDGLTFHSGNPVTAQDAAYSLHRAINLAKTPVFILDQFGWTPENVDSLIVAQDDHTLSVTIVTEFSPAVVLNALSAGIGAVVDSKLVQEHEVDGDWGYAWLKTTSAGSGPFMVNQWNPNENVILDRFEGYRAGAPAMERIFYRNITEPSAQLLALQQGDVDMARNLTADQVAGLAGVDGVKVEAFPKATLIYLAANTSEGPLANSAFHDAMRALVDYEGMESSFLSGSWRIHQAFWPAGLWGSYDETPYSLDVEAAKAILADAGLDSGLSFTLDTLNKQPFLDIAQSLQQTFAEAGIALEIQPAEGSALWPKYRARRHQLILAQWSPDYVDPHSNADAFAHNPDNSIEAGLTGKLTWRNAWAAEELTPMVEAARMETDTAARAAMYQEIQAIHQADSPFVVMFQEIQQVGMRDTVEGFVSGASFDMIFYRNVTK